MVRRLPTGLVAACALLAVAPARAADPADPCALVAKADAAAAIGSPITSVNGMTAGPSRSCSFHGAKSLLSVVVTTFAYASPAQAHERFIDIVKQTARAASAPATKLGGVGDEAVAINSSVYVRKGTAALVFNVFGPRGGALTARAVTLAKKTIAHLR